MIKSEVIGVDQIGTNSEHVFYSSEEADKLVLFFPGGNSNTTGPFFYYLSDYFLRNGYDVLSLSYRGLVVEGESYDIQIKKITDGAHKAIAHVKEKKTYHTMVFVSRSIGNVLSNTTRMNYDLDVDKCIYISPTAQALPDIEKFPGFIITSDKDEYLEEKHLQEMLLYPHHEILLFEGGDHSLECDDTIKNIDFCRKAISNAIEYVSLRK